ncbi:MAG: IS21-like element helper ATPase IstB [Actinomycetota bacterium]|jgi:DNA replication protein DnaC|nr:IS21-like element helper ATPase IstB [Actinomycetota bacterium]
MSAPEVTTSPYEQLKNDLGYLQLGRALECFATIADQAKKERWSHVAYLAAVIAEQASATSNRLAARLRFARFPFRRTIEEFDFEFQPSVDRELVYDLASLRLIAEGRSIAWLGQPGCGKTHLAVALATLAVEAGYRGCFTTADDMVVTLARARIEGTWAAKLRAYTAPTVLVIDDVGLLPMARDAATGFFHVINTRYEKGVPTLVTSNRSLPSWGELFGDDVVAAAILDRILHRCVVFNIKGPSWRVKEHQGLTGGPSPSSNGRQRP